MPNDGTVKIGTEIDESGFRKGLSKLGKTSDAGLKAGTEAVAGMAKAADGAVTGLLHVQQAAEDTSGAAELAAQSLTTMETAADHLDSTLGKSKLDDFGESIDRTSEKADDAARKLADFDPALEQVNDSAKDAAGGLDDMGDSAEGSVGGFDTLGTAIGTFAGGVMTKLLDLAIQAAQAIWNLDEATEEYRESMAMLNTAFETAGFSQETATEAYRGFYRILGETDTATEASQLLAQLATSSEDVSKWVDIAAGVYGTFGDALPIEGLIEAANETAKTGEVTGVLADALNWVGISEDEVNDKLSQFVDTTSRAKYLTELLGGAYQETADTFYENNASIMEARDAQADLDETTAVLGESIGNLKTKLMDAFGPAIIEIVEALASAIEAITPLLEGIAFVIGTIIDAVATLVGWIWEADDGFLALIGIGGKSKAAASTSSSRSASPANASGGRPTGRSIPAPANGPANTPVTANGAGAMGAESLTAGRNRVLRALENSIPSMEQRVTVSTAAMMPSSAYADPFAAHRAYAQTGQNEQGQSAAPQRLKVDIEIKPREAARFLKPKIDEETNRQGTSLTRGG